MQIIDHKALSRCIRDAVRAELQEHFRQSGDGTPSRQERLLSKKELAEELGISLVTLTDWMKKGLPYLRLQKRVYFKRSEVLAIMQQKNNER
ncbi:MULTISPECIES: helix-turn-helix transcriptional regulator [Sphingobacterium]|uniref:helix-turn-helix transcriptional regulator n=1 Tax=Sphingobacterium TaxID=28453 RepID=UPI0021A52A40|nr:MULTISPECIES: helix-turn-helix domain-containing protein [Sphingobacterium]MCT1524872.1 helix-turn-helix domain-containing protein [Sphingobacterium hotanense]